MSTAARVLLDAMKRYSNKLEYDVCDVEWYAHTYLVSTLENWWKSKIRSGAGISNSHDWFLPEPGSMNWRNFSTYVSKSQQRKIIFELTWDDNLKQVYHYLCGKVLLADFGVEEFRRITVLAIYPLLKVQKAVAMAKSSSRGPISTPYILSILERGEQAKQTQSDRIQEKIEASKKSMIKRKIRRASTLEATLMKAQFGEVKMCIDMDVAMEKKKKELYRYAITRR
jgi:hypothetical protein